MKKILIVNKYCAIMFILCLLAVPIMPTFDSPRAGAEEPSNICLTNESQLLGQDWEIGGAITSVSPSLPAADAALDYDRVADEITSVSGSLPAKPIVILIIDDFVENRPGMPYAHGDYVYEVAKQLLEGSGVLVDMRSYPRPAIPLASDNMIVLDYIDASEDYLVDEIKSGILSKLALYSGENSYHTFVLNMSFVLLPCDAEITANGQTFKYQFPEFMSQYRERRAEDDYSFVQYLIDLFERNGVTVTRKQVRSAVGEVLGQYSSNSLLDPLHEYLDSMLPPGEDILIPIASAGNFGDYDPDGNGIAEPFAPGIWPQVISVSATKLDVNGFRGMAWFSNSGEVASTPGQWYQIPKTGEYIAGTSFSAPTMSVLAAWLEATKSQCDFTVLEDKPAFDNEYYIDAVKNLGVCQ